MNKTDATNTDSARTAPVCAWPAGTASTAPSRAAPRNVPNTDSANRHPKEAGAAAVRKAGKVPTVPFRWNSSAKMARTTTKVPEGCSIFRLIDRPCD